MKIELKNRLHLLLRQRGIRSAAEFARRLATEQNYPVSRSHATRYVRADPPSIDLAFAIAACNLLQCLPSDLYEIRILLEPGEEIDPYLAVPQHASVLRGRDNPSGPRVVPKAPPATSASAQAAPRPASMKSEDTGPSPSIFPVLKPKGRS
jgi:hypothetical protein